MLPLSCSTCRSPWDFSALASAPWSECSIWRGKVYSQLHAPLHALCLLVGCTGPLYALLPLSAGSGVRLHVHLPLRSLDVVREVYLWPVWVCVRVGVLLGNRRTPPGVVLRGVALFRGSLLRLLGLLCLWRLLRLLGLLGLLRSSLRLPSLPRLLRLLRLFWRLRSLRSRLSAFRAAGRFGRLEKLGNISGRLRLLDCVLGLCVPARFSKAFHPRLPLTELVQLHLVQRPALDHWLWILDGFFLLWLRLLAAREDSGLLLLLRNRLLGLRLDVLHLSGAEDLLLVVLLRR